MNRRLIRTTGFIRAAKRYLKTHPQSLESLRDSLSLLESDAFAPALRTHKLKGVLSDKWSCNGGYDLRIVFEFVQENGVENILLLSVGSHDEVY